MYSEPVKGLQYVTDRGVDTAPADTAVRELVSQAAPERKKTKIFLMVLLYRMPLFWLKRCGILDPYPELRE
jgi:hypothetical protein